MQGEPSSAEVSVPSTSVRRRTSRDGREFFVVEVPLGTRAGDAVEWL